MKYGCSGWWWSWAICSDLRMMALLMRSGRLGVGRPIIFEHVWVTLRSLFLLLRGSMVK